VILAKNYFGFKFLHSEISTVIIISLIIIIVIIIKIIIVIITITSIGLTPVSPSIGQYQGRPKDPKKQHHPTIQQRDHVENNQGINLIN
jgi:uncharacterized SAM-binding protein YcdF (DUF218 family)